MYRSFRYENESDLNLKIPWDTNTARGFAVALIFVIILLFLAPHIYLTPPIPRDISSNTVPTTVWLSFGEGDGTGLSKGNLTEEGKAHKGKKPNSVLEDAQIASNTKLNKNAQTTDFAEANRVNPVSQLDATEKNDESLKGNARKNVGDPDGFDDGSGMGLSGSGIGKGKGFGDIDWGGGGNRTVLYKKIPVFPSGVSKNAVIKMRFTVQPDGTVSSVMPMQKADPKLERAATEALRMWRFNPLKDNTVMVGIIPMSFQLR